ncbi:Ankyrin repeat-containing domain protein [Metarhizium guizhouense ARSEF 977]|uniref:Ankyrin repeat-containing domain protein n=1 Tax=Metarhizium guizhouense (strain ARSEF 977) TaxID=1276136 RepID=A0A0B4H800_METGA|nr:Ankyrin repeat-containing domain protein [Metarhizium guizhouense ARSEF 977]
MERTEGQNRTLQIDDDDEALLGDAKGRKLDEAQDESPKKTESQHAAREKGDPPYQLGYINDKYHVGWISAIHHENVAARVFLDNEYDGPYDKSPTDSNDYTLGKIKEHNVVVAVLPAGEYGVASAAQVAANMMRTFPKIKIGLMVGIGGGAPHHKHDIRLGDVVVSVPRNRFGGVFHYNFGKSIQGKKFQETKHLNRPPSSLLAAVNGLRSQYAIGGHPLKKNIDDVLEKYPDLQEEYSRPDPGSDRLYKSDIIHTSDDDAPCAKVCSQDPSCLVPRSERPKKKEITIHYGLIASADNLLKDAHIRDKLATENDVLCFEMEAAGLMNTFPCLAIRGICDYADTHKNDEWQGYAAMTAAAYAKNLLERIRPEHVEVERNISEVLLDVQDGVHKLVDKQHEREHQHILDWLTQVNYAPLQSDLLRKRQAQTGQWLLDSTPFRDWIKAMDYLQERFRDQQNIAIAYIYFRYNVEQTVDDVLLNLLKQLAQTQGSLPSVVGELYNKHKGRQTRPCLDETRRALQFLIPLYSRVFIVIDGLDECRIPGGCRKDFLAEMINLQATCGTSVCATSRFLPDITEKFDNKSSPHFIGSKQIEIRADVEDIKKYLDGHMHRLPSVVQNSPQLQLEIKTRIAEAADGMFLLAKIYLDFLEDKLTPKAIINALDKFQRRSRGSDSYDRSQVLANAFDDAMQRVNAQSPGRRELAVQVLGWITCARRALTTLELQHALAVEINKPEFDENNLADIQDLVSVCAGLVTIDEESMAIRLVHYTLQEYLENTQDKWFRNLQAQMALKCVTYLSFSAFESGRCQCEEDLEERLRLHPFYIYAACDWGHHAREAETPYDDVEYFLRCQKKVEASIQALWFIRQRPRCTLYTFIEHRNPQTPGLHSAAYFGIYSAVWGQLVKNNMDPNSRDADNQTPMSYAAENGHVAVVKLLLDHGADANLNFKFGSESPLFNAASRGHLAIVKLLLDNGADANKDVLSRPLEYAARRGYLAIVKLLLDNGADANKDVHSKPLDHAARRGYLAIVKLLLDKGAKVDSKNEYGGTALWHAVVKGHKAVVELLLEKGANIDSKDINEQTPLMAAAAIGDASMVMFLLEKGADINTKDRNRRTSLWLASKEPDAAIVKLLLEKGAHVDPQDDDQGRTPLIWAVIRRDESLVSLLLQNGASCEMKDKDGRTPLSWAEEKGYETIIQLLKR